MDLLPILIWLIVLLVAVCFLPYIVGPCLLHSRFFQQADPEVVPFPIDHPSMPEFVKDYFEDVRDELAGVGFVPVAGMALPRQMAKVKPLVLLFVNRKTKEAATATVLFIEGPRAVSRDAHVDILARYRNGTVIHTSNTKILPVFPAKATFIATRLPSVRDAAVLYRIHSALAQRHGSGVPFLRLDEEFHGDACALLASGMREELAYQVEVGYMRLDERAGKYRPTWKGAFSIAWSVLFPWKHLRRARRDRMEWLLLRELKSK
jgi:hypothetical protein